MDKFLTYPGKQPVYLGDIDFMQTAARSALQNLMKAYTGRSDANAILYGVDITYANNAITWTAGVVSIGGEILPVVAGTVGGEAGPGYFSIVSASGGSRIFGDGNQHDCWETRSATIIKTTTDYPVASFKRISPVDTPEALVHEFDGIANLTDRYARLANCSGAFLLSIRRPAQAEESQIVFQGDVSDLTAGELAKFSASNAPTRMLSVAEMDSSGDLYPVTINWSIVSGKLHFEIVRGLTAFDSPYEIRATLPVF